MLKMVQGLAIVGTMAVMSPAQADKSKDHHQMTHGDKHMSCGHMFAEKAVLPATMAEVMKNVAAMLNAHADFSANSADGKAEAEGLRALAKQHSDLEVMFTATAAKMNEAASWPEAKHDMKAMKEDPKLKEAMMTMLKSHEKMAALLNKEVKAMKAHMKMHHK